MALEALLQIWRLTQDLLQLPPRDYDIEELIHSPNLHIGLLSEGIIALHQGVVCLMQVDGFLVLKTFGEVLPRKERTYSKMEELIQQFKSVTDKKTHSASKIS